MDKQRKSFWEFFIEDTINNPPFYTTAEVTGIEKDNLLITYMDTYGERHTKRVRVKDATNHSLGEILDIQVCGGHFPSIFISPKLLC